MDDVEISADEFIVNKTVEVFDTSEFDKWFKSKGDPGTLLHIMENYGVCKKAFNDWKSGKLDNLGFKEVLSMFFE